MSVMARETREPVTRDRIGRVALAVIDAEGTRAVTMRRVAGELGIQAPSLYAHVTGRDEILGLAHAVVMAEVGPFRGTGDWRGDLEDYYRRMHRVLVAHGDIASVQFGSIITTERSLAAFEQTIRALVDAGLPSGIAAAAIERLSLYVTADAYEQWEFRQRGGDPAAQASELISEAAPGLAELLGDFDLGEHGPFGFGLELIIAGIGALADRAAD